MIAHEAIFSVTRWGGRPFRLGTLIMVAYTQKYRNSFCYYNTYWDCPHKNSRKHENGGIPTIPNTILESSTQENGGK